jgi:CRP/FNR family transcriptional regulator
MLRLALEQTELFDSLAPPQVARLSAGARVQATRAGEYLYLDSEPARSLWIVRSGSARTLKASPSGRITTLEQLGTGQPFGLASVIGSSYYGESAQVLEAGEVWRVRRALINALIDQVPGLSRVFLDLAARRLQGAHDRLCSFAYDSVPARIAQTLLEHANGERIQLTRRALGESVGSTVETTIRVLRGFERAGWIEGGVGWIRTIDRDALDRVAHGEPGGPAR